MQQQRDALNAAAAQSQAAVQTQAETFGRSLFAAQVNAIPEIPAGDAIPRGDNAIRAGLAVGKPLPPTSVRVIHY